MTVVSPIQAAEQQRKRQLTQADADKLAKNNLCLLIDKMKGEIGKALPSVITPERFTRLVLSAVSSNPQLAKCTQQSFFGAMMTAAQLGLEVNTPMGQAYLIPRNNRGVMECTFQLGYKGMIDLAYRSGSISTIGAQTVYEHDHFEFELGLEPKLIHRPCMTGDRGKAVAYYAAYHTKDGGYGFEVASRDEMEAFARQYSAAYSKGYSTPWKTNFDEMAKKTVVKRVLKYAPVSAEYQLAAAGDEQVRNMPASMTDYSGNILDEPVVYADPVEVVDPDSGEVVEAEK